MKKIVRKIIKYMNEKSKFTRAVKNKLVSIYMGKRCKKLSRKTPTNDKMVIFEAFLGKMYACSPKAIYQYMLQDERFRDFTFVWVFREAKLKQLGHEFTDSRTILVSYKSAEYFKYYAEAKYWVTNWRISNYIAKKKEQIMIQTWHGTPLKKIGIDSAIEGNPLYAQKTLHKLYLKDSGNYDYLISPSAFCTRVFTTAFGLDKLQKQNILIETGYPRNDYLIDFQPEDAERTKEKLKIPKDKKVILYAPTWRDNQRTAGVGHTLDVNMHFSKFMEELNDDYVVILRLHYLVANQIDLSGYFGKVFDCSKVDDVNELYIISDILITDYSSVFFDYANLRRPIIFYMYDLEEYQTQIRDFYIDLNELPGPIVEKEEELLNAIYEIEKIEEEYKQKYKQFCDTYTYLDDGQAAKHVVDIVFGTSC